MKQFIKAGLASLAFSGLLPVLFTPRAQAREFAAFWLSGCDFIGRWCMVAYSSL